MMPLAVILSALLLAATAPAPPPPATAVVQGFQAWLDGTATLDVRFRQSLVSGALGATAIESGRMYLERPGKIRWDYLEPERKVALLVGDRTELYVEDDRQLTRGRLTAEQSIFPRLLSGSDRIETSFVAETVAAPTSSGPRRYRLKLVPRGEGTSLSEVTLVLLAPDFAIESAEVLDEMGNRTSYLFSGAKRNGRLPDGIFAFEPPPGTEVVAEP
jgi:outer membrane lipoprotein carrier protein